MFGQKIHPSSVVSIFRYFCFPLYLPYVLFLGRFCPFAVTAVTMFSLSPSFSLSLSLFVSFSLPHFCRPYTEARTRCFMASSEAKPYCRQKRGLYEQRPAKTQLRMKKGGEETGRPSFSSSRKCRRDRLLKKCQQLRRRRRRRQHSTGGLLDLTLQQQKKRECFRSEGSESRLD